jgi:hypothetical protein
VRLRGASHEFRHIIVWQYLRGFAPDQARRMAQQQIGVEAVLD